jgi:hypothetical protein
METFAKSNKFKPWKLRKNQSLQTVPQNSHRKRHRHSARDENQHNKVVEDRPNPGRTITLQIATTSHTGQQSMEGMAQRHQAMPAS